MALHTLMVVILIQLPTTGEPTLFHTLCAGEQSVSARRQMYECIEEEECGEEDEDKFTGRIYIDKHRPKTTKQSIYHLIPRRLTVRVIVRQIRPISIFVIYINCIVIFVKVCNNIVGLN